MIIGITGLAQAGKDTAAKYLIEHYDFERRAFADKVKEFSLAINPRLKEAVDAVGWEAAKQIPEFRRFLQDVGHNARLLFGFDFWVDQVLPNNNIDRDIVLTDMRYSNEFERVLWHSGISIRIIRPGLGLVNDHVTETQHLNIPVDHTVTNDTLEHLYAQLKEIMDRLGR
jgi:hypothetical protein